MGTRYGMPHACGGYPPTYSAIGIFTASEKWQFTRQRWQCIQLLNMESRVHRNHPRKIITLPAPWQERTESGDKYYHARRLNTRNHSMKVKAREIHRRPDGWIPQPKCSTRINCHASHAIRVFDSEYRPGYDSYRDENKCSNRIFITWKRKTHLIPFGMECWPDPVARMTNIKNGDTNETQ